jgi:hypothetical protein
MAKQFQAPFIQTPKHGSVEVTAANTNSKGTGTIGTDVFLAWTAGAEGGYVTDLVWQPTATAPTATTATVGRAFMADQSSGALTVSDVIPLGEVALPATNADNASAAAQPFVIPINRQVPAGWSIVVTTHHAPAANTAWKACVFGGDY